MVLVLLYYILHYYYYITSVMEDWMFGALEVDLELPDHLKGKAAEMPPVFKNTHVSREDIGDHMKMYAEERGIMNQKRKCLIGSNVVSDVLSGYVCVLEDWRHLSSLPFQVVRKFQVYFQGTKHPVFHHCS
jgi:hypothetical protein